MSTIITTSPIVDTVRNAFDFSVDKFPLTGPENMRTPHYGLFRSDNGECVGRACKAGYVPHTVDDVLAITEAVASVWDADTAPQVETLFANGHHVQIRPTENYRREIFDAKRAGKIADAIFPRLVIRAGYDARAFTVSVGLYRDACRNMVMIEAARETVTSIRHTRSLRENVGKLVDQLRGLQAGWANVADAAERMESRELIVADYLAEIYGRPEELTSQRAVTMHRRRTDAILNRLVREYQATGRDEAQVQSGRATGWMLFNAVQGWSQHDQSRRATHPLARAFASDSDRAVRQAATLALGA